MLPCLRGYLIGLTKLLKKLPQITITKVNDAKNITSFTRKILQPNAPILSTRQKNN